jgi:hypothetical protein
MTSPDQPDPDRAAWSRVDRRRDRIRAEIRRNREGSHRIPTWALATTLALLLLGWLYLLLTG